MAVSPIVARTIELGLDPGCVKPVCATALNAGLGATIASHRGLWRCRFSQVSEGRAAGSWHMSQQGSANRRRSLDQSDGAGYRQSLARLLRLSAHPHVDDLHHPAEWYLGDFPASIFTKSGSIDIGALPNHDATLTTRYTPFPTTSHPPLCSQKTSRVACRSSSKNVRIVRSKSKNPGIPARVPHL
ncbi:hypothetical protein ABIB82_006636 [Bradyrhizobium sp. i1.8.4]